MQNRETENKEQRTKNKTKMLKCICSMFLFFVLVRYPLHVTHPPRRATRQQGR